jgi:DNA-binding transcriptional ArsR family regulator
MTRALAEEDRLLAAVAEPTRRRLLDHLLTDGEATATALAAGVPVTRQAVCKHLSVLGRAGLVESRREGREVRFSLHRQRLDEAARSLAEVARSWDQRLVAIKRLAEATHRKAQGG